jgi:hypothetical protein
MDIILNYTPHEIVIVGSVNEVIMRIPSSGSARCHSEQLQAAWVNEIPLNITVFNEVIGLPDPQKDTVIVVPLNVAETLRGTRHDIVVLDDVVHDEDNVIKARAFAWII